MGCDAVNLARAVRISGDDGQEGRHLAKKRAANDAMRWILLKVVQHPQQFTHGVSPADA